MSRPPSPISPPNSLLYDPSATLRIINNNNTDFDNVRFKDDVENMNRMNQLAEPQPQLNYTYGSIVEDSCCSKPDPEELQQDLLELEHTNRRLQEENVELNHQITSSEESNTSLRQHCHQLEHALSSIQHQLVGARRMEEEVQELRLLLDSEQEEKGQLLLKVSNLEKENNTLSSKLKDLQIQLNNAQEDLENYSLREANLIQEHRAEVTTLAQKLHQYKTEALQEVEDAKFLREALEELEKIHEALQEEKTSLEEQLIHVKGQLAAMTSRSDPEISGELEDIGINGSSASKMPKLPWGPSLYSSPFPVELSHKSIPDTPLSIHSEIQTMNEHAGSLPFCEKSDEGLLSASHSSDDGYLLNLSPQSKKEEMSSLALITSMLKWWHDWEEQCKPLMKEFENEKTTLLHAHFLTHHDKLLKLEKELQNIVKKRQGHQSPSQSRKSSKSFSFSSPPRRSSRNGSLDTRSPESDVEVLETPCSKTSSGHTPRTPGPSVSLLISKFEHSSRSSSPAASERSERSGLVDFNSNVAKVIELESENEQNICVSPELKDTKSSPKYDFLRGSKILNRSRIMRQEAFGEDFGNISNFLTNEEAGNEDIESICETKDAIENISEPPVPLDCDAGEILDRLDSGFEQDVEYSMLTAGSQPLHDHYTSNNVNVAKQKTKVIQGMLNDNGVILEAGLDEEDPDTEKDSQIVQENAGTPLRRKLLLKCNTASSAGSTTVEMDMEIDTDMYMENSQLMKLMKEVKDQEALIQKFKKQMNESEEEKEVCLSVLNRIHRLVLHVTGCTFRWTEGVRKEWLASVPVGREDEGATHPLRTPDPLDDGPLTTTHSREEIESLIHTRCDLGCQVSREDFSRDYVNPESLAIELERELLALKLHVARSHALLHHYQSSSLHGSRSEVSTPPVSSSHHLQGVEAGVEADLCGPTCVPRPCDSTATQTPASPISVSPECGASGGDEASGSVCGSNDGTIEDLQDDHRPLTPQHRPLYQRMSVSEEEVEEESAVACGHAMATSVPSDHAIYAPKPTYDQLDQYSLSKKNEEKQRRSGLATIAPKTTGDGSSDSEEEEDEDTRKLLKMCSSPRRNRPVLTRHPRCHSDPVVAPLSPPPSLDKEDDELAIERMEMEVVGDDEEPELPSTPESSPSNASTSEVFSRDPAESKNDTRDRFPNGQLPQVNVIPTGTPNITSGDLSPVTPPTHVSTATWIFPESENDRNTSNVFPSLQDVHLRAFGASVQDSPTNENLSAQEIETKFKQISLAFKTDRITLKQRLEVQQRQRDIAEVNFERELDQLKCSILALHEDCIDMELVEAIMQVRKHLDVLTISSTSLLSASEVWGAVQQEWRVSRALEVLLLHVENVKRLYENDHQELEEMRRVLQEHQIEYPATGGPGGSGQSSSGDTPLGGSIRIRALSLAGVSNKSQESGGSRRISLGPGASKTVLNNFLGGRNSRRRASLMPDLRPFHQDFVAVAAAAAAAANSTNTSSKERLEEKRHSTNGMLGSSITEEGSESGDENAANSRSAAGDSLPTVSATKSTHFPHDVYGSGMQDIDQRSNEDGTSPVLPSSSDSHVSSSPTSSLTYQSQHWVMHGFEDFVGWLRGGRWPFSSQQTYRGVRYFFTTFLLILAAFFLLLTISSGDEVQQPCHPGWTTIHHVLHPYVTIRHWGGQF